MSRHRSISKRAPPDIGLHMECIEEELEPSQIAYYNKAEKEFHDVQCKLDHYVKKMRAEVVEKGENCFVLQLNASPGNGQVSSPPSSGKSARQSLQTNQNYQQMMGPGILTRSTASSGGNTYLVMDPRLGFMVSQMHSSNIANEQSIVPSKSASSGRGRPTSSGNVMVTTRAKSNLKKQAHGNESELLTPPLKRTRDKAKNQHSASSQNSSQIIQHPQAFSVGNQSDCGNYKMKINAKPLQTPTKPGEVNALGGLSAGSKTPWKPSNVEDSGKSSPDSREVVFNKAAGKTFPSLMVTARPHLKVKFISEAAVGQERSALDAKVKGVLMYSSTKFIEWLIQQGLIKSEQICETHVNNDLSPVKLKLGMYSDVTKFPYSGGYVWISDCCPSQFVSVFSGSIFEGAPHPPTTLLKLIYHWACQTNVQNVVQWVKVDNLYLKNFYMNMRAVCTQAVHEKYKKMGGSRKKIEVGVISLGTTSQDGCRRQVKVEVLGVMDQESKLIRLRAVEPLSDERSYKKRFVKILEPLEEWVNKDSTILTDFTIAKASLNSMGFHTVFQVTNESKYSNHNIMEYLRKIVPKMFQNTLSLLSRQIIQQFLDELVWREMWGPFPSQAFANIVAHIAEQTKLDAGENFLIRLNKVASNPLKRWDYSVWKPAPTTRSHSKTQQKLSGSQEAISEVLSEPAENLVPVTKIRTRKRAAEQSSVETVISKKIPKISVKEKLKKEEKVEKKDKECGEKSAEDGAKSINEGRQIFLSSYYYGTLRGAEHRDKIPKGRFNAKCCVCNKRFTSNLILMKHMILHCQMEPALTIDLKKVHQCSYCFLGFNSSSALKAHLGEVHCIADGKINSDFLCRICEEKFKNKTDLTFHMHKTHVELELPYKCGVCHFRTSIFTNFVKHFETAHDQENYVFCPYCLKVVTLVYKAEPIPSNILFYLSHLEKHHRLTLIKDCHRCQLSFIHKGILDQHLEGDHGSWKDEAGILPVANIPEGPSILAPGPNAKPAPAIRTQKSPKAKNLFSANKFRSLEVHGVDESMACLECEESLGNSEHFTGCFSCTKCLFSSCCERAMLEHLAIFHENLPPHFTKGKPIILPQEMYCVCGYSSTSGNRLAKHLVLCEKKSAYFSEKSASAAVQFSTVDDANKHGEGQNVLNMLGLVRKSPESIAVSSGNEPAKMEVENNDTKSENQSLQDLEKRPRSEIEGSPIKRKHREAPKNSEKAPLTVEGRKEKVESFEKQNSDEEPKTQKGEHNAELLGNSTNVICEDKICLETPNVEEMEKPSLKKIPNFVSEEPKTTSA